MTRLRPAALLAPLVLTGALLAGCGGDGGRGTDPAATLSPTGSGTGSGTGSASGSAPTSGATDGPGCAEVWVAGETLPRDYDGCVRDGRPVPADGRYCEFGKPLVTFDDRFWSVPGGRIGEAAGPLLEDPDYEDVLRKCSG